MKKILTEIKQNYRKLSLFLIIDFLICPLILFYLLEGVFTDIPNNEQTIKLSFGYFLSSGINFIIWHYICYKFIYPNSLKERDITIFNLMALMSFIIYIYSVYTIFTSSNEMGANLVVSLFLFTIPLSFLVVRNMMARKMGYE